MLSSLGVPTRIRETMASTSDVWGWRFRFVAALDAATSHSAWIPPCSESRLVRAPALVLMMSAMVASGRGLSNEVQPRGWRADTTVRETRSPRLASVARGPSLPGGGSRPTTRSARLDRLRPSVPAAGLRGTGPLPALREWRLGRHRRHRQSRRRRPRSQRLRRRLAPHDSEERLRRKRAVLPDREFGPRQQQKIALRLRQAQHLPHSELGPVEFHEVASSSMCSGASSGRAASARIGSKTFSARNFTTGTATASPVSV
jgi:hypothetical protein